MPGRRLEEHAATVGPPLTGHGPPVEQGAKKAGHRHSRMDRPSPQYNLMA